MKRSESCAWSEKEKKKLVVFMITITLFSGRTKKNISFVVLVSSH